MHNYTPIVFSVLLLLGNASSSQALITGNEIELSATFFRGNAKNNHGDVKSPPQRGSIRKGYRFVNTISTSRLDDRDIFPHRGSGR